MEHKVIIQPEGTRYVSLVMKPYQGHIYKGTKQQQNRTERKRSK